MLHAGVTEPRLVLGQLLERDPDPERVTILLLSPVLALRPRLRGLVVPARGRARAPFAAAAPTP